MKFNLVLGLAALLATAGALTASAGVSVGNAQGTDSYWSEAGKFAVQFDSSLSLKEQGPGDFAISNEKLVAQGGRRSSVSFSTAATDLTSLEELAAKAAELYPSRHFAPVSLNGVAGLASEERTEDKVSAVYLVINASQLVRAHVDAFANGEGIKLIAPIVQTFAPDSTPPVLLNIRFENYVWTAGTTQTVHFQARDDVSGLRSFGNLRFHQLGADGKVIPGSPEIDAGGWGYSNGNFKAEGGDWYSWTVPLDVHLPVGEFVLDTLSLSDQAHNTTLVGIPYSRDSGEAPLPEFYNENGKPTQVHVLKVRIENPSGNVDVTPPHFNGFRPDTSVWEAGSTHRVYFKITDDNSGLDVAHSYVMGLNSVDKQYQLGTLAIRSEGNDWYSADVKVSPFQPSGVYRGNEVLLNDKAGNSTVKVPPADEGLESMFSVVVRNSAREDREVPSVDQWRFDSATVAPGGTQRLTVHLNEGPSGIASLRADLSNGDVMVDMTNDDYQSLGNGWYSMGIKVGPFLPASPAFLESMYITTSVGRVFYVTCDTEKCGVYNQPNEPFALKPLTFHIVR